MPPGDRGLGATIANFQKWRPALPAESTLQDRCLRPQEEAGGRPMHV